MTIKNFFFFPNDILPAIHGAMEQNKGEDKIFSKSGAKPVENSKQSQTWVFILAGQSNMAGRGLVEPQDNCSQCKVYT